MTFIGLFLLAVSMNEYIDPRSRLSRMGAADDGEAGVLDRVEDLRAYYLTRATSASSARSAPSTTSASTSPQRDLRPRRRIELRQDDADQDHRRRHPAAAATWSAASVEFHFLTGRSTSTRAAAPSWRAIRWKHLSYIMQGSMNVLNPVRRVRHSFVDFAFRHIGRPMPAVPRDRARPPAAPASRRPTCSTPIRTSSPAACASASPSRSPPSAGPNSSSPTSRRRRSTSSCRRTCSAMIREIQREIGSSMLFVTHDMAVHANLADRLGIMYAGRLVEEGARPPSIFRTPLHPYTAHLIASLPRIGDAAPKAGPRRRAAQSRRSAAGLPLPSALPAGHGDLPPRDAADGLSCADGHRVACFAVPRGAARHERAAARGRRTSAKIYRRGGLFSRRRDPRRRRRQLHASTRTSPEIFTIIGESGSGKTTLARMILNIECRPAPARSASTGTDLATIRGSARPAGLHAARSSRSSRTRSRPSTR